MPTATFETFQTELARIVESFAHNLAEHKKPSYVEAQLRDDFLNPFFAALGWDITNAARVIETNAKSNLNPTPKSLAVTASSAAKNLIPRCQMRLLGSKFQPTMVTFITFGHAGER